MSKEMIITMLKIIVLSFLTVVIDFFKWDIIAKITYKYNGLIAGAFYYFVVVVRVVLLVILIIWSIKYIKSNFKDYKILSLIPSAFLIIIMLIQFILPITDLYAKFEYKFNKDNREKIVAMLNGSEEMKLMQINSDTYILPFELRCASYNAKIITEKDNNTLKILFYIHRGALKNSGIIYSSSEEESIENSYFGLTFDKIIPIEKNWYLIEH